MVLFGLDFGTTYSTISVYKGGRLFTFLQQNSSNIPTYVFLHDDGKRMAYGYDAETLSLDRSVKGSFFRDLKRWVGCDEDNLAEYVKLLRPHYSHSLVNFGSGYKKVPQIGAFSGSKSMEGTVSGLIALFIRAVVRDACKTFECECTGIIVSVPAKYTCLQRSFMMNCVTMSGYQCVYMLNEPSAAALSIAAKLSADDSNVFVYDFGGGTFDVSAISVSQQTFVVRASGGDMNLGGRDVDKSFCDLLYSRVSQEPNYEADLSALKESLSQSGEPIKYSLKLLGGGSKELMVDLDMLSSVTEVYVNRTVEIMNRVFEAYKSSMGIVDDGTKVSLVLVGGSSYLPGLKSRLGSVDYIDKFFSIPDPRAAVSVGCALFSSCITKESSLILVDCASHNLSTPNFELESIVCISAGSAVPAVGKRSLNLLNANANSVYTACLFEGDYNKCCLNKRIYYGDIKLSDIGVNSPGRSTVSITLETNISSVGTVEFNIVGPSGRRVLVGGKSAYDFGSSKLGERIVVDLYTSNYNRALLALILTRSEDSRARFGENDKNRLATLKELPDLEATFKLFNVTDGPETELCRSIMGKSVRQILRGSKLQELFV